MNPRGEKRDRERRDSIRDRRASAADRRGATADLQPAIEHRAPVADPVERFRRRVAIESVAPSVDGGRFPIKRTVGESVDVSAEIFADGHGVISAVVRARAISPVTLDTTAGHVRADAGGDDQEEPMMLAGAGLDLWHGRFVVNTMGWYDYQVVAWLDRFKTWRRELEIKRNAGQELTVDLLEGAWLVREAAERAAASASRDLSGDRSECGDAADWLLRRADALNDRRPLDECLALALDPQLGELMDRYTDRSSATISPTFRVWVDRERARFGAWYEMFPRSVATGARRGGTFEEAARHLSYVADLGFDVVYLPPIHPIGRSFRKGPNNSLVAGPDDPGSPWAIGSAAGGHTAVDPGLGTIHDFDAFREEAGRLGLELALDLAWQCSPDHPWVTEHPEWFKHRPDGTIAYAENPPKKYQDIYPFDFECEEWRDLWRALLDVTLFWIGHGVQIFRVDNPHTKPFGFWEWMIGQVHVCHPEVVFLAEAFTRPAPMRYLAKAGFSQSYTYFTWRNTKSEIVELFTELTATGVSEYLRANLFANTPDILSGYLQEGGRPAFEARLLLASTLGASYGIYSGFELGENLAAAPGSEEYADSEKYQLRPRNWDATGNIKELIARVNRIRRRQPALHGDRTLRFHDTDNPEIIAYSKGGPGNLLLTIVNLDPHHMQHGFVRVPLDLAELSADRSYAACDLLDDVRYEWRGEWNYVRFDPGVRQGHVLRLLADAGHRTRRHA
jgi:starch synthase (maltosyl-transferring)